MKNWKKPLAAVLAGMLCIISMPQVQPFLPAFSAAAAEETGTVGALTYTLKSDRAIITQCDKNAEEVEIPSEIAGKPVLQIAERAFLSHEKLTRVVIPDTVRTIENLAFSHCSQLQEVTLPKYLVTIGRDCFSYCAQLEELDVPKTVKNIGHSAFYGTAWLKHQQAENPLVQVNHILIDANACTDTTIVVPDGVTEAISVDMGCVGEGLTCDERMVSICAKDSGGPYNYDVVRGLIAAAEKMGAPYAVDVYPSYGSDVEATLRAGYDIRHGLIGSGVYASHGYERSHVEGALATLKTLIGYVG